MKKRTLFGILACIAVLTFAGCGGTPEQVDYKEGKEAYDNAQEVTEKVDELNRQIGDFQKDVDKLDGIK